MNLGAKRLKDFLTRREMSQAYFARAVETSDATIHRILQGDNIPELPLAIRIKQYTDSYIIPEDFTKTDCEQKVVAQ